MAVSQLVLRGQPERKGASSTLVTSSCSWLGQDASSALREMGPSSTERTLSANFREHSVSLVFFSAGETCSQQEQQCQPTSHPPSSQALLPQLSSTANATNVGVMLLLTCRS